MTETPKKPTPRVPNAAPPQMTRRAKARWERERDNQRLVLGIAGTAVGLAVVAIVAGLLYDRVWVPSRPVAQVADATLSRGGYWTERRYEIGRNIAQNLQLLRLFGSQLSGQFGQQLPALDAQVPDIEVAPVDDTTVNGWIDRQIIARGANSLGIQASDGDIAQTLVNDLNRGFPPPPPIITDTNQVSPTATVAATAAPTAAVTSTTVISPTTGPTATPEPTSTPEPTFAPDQALQQQDGVLQRVYEAYTQELANIDSQRTPRLTLEDFRAGLRDQYQRQTLTNKVQERLVPDDQNFTPTTEPSSIGVSHILISVTLPLSPTEAQREAAFAQRRPEAEAILAQLRGGADFATVARERSEDGTTREQGGDLPAFDNTGKTQQNTQIDPAILQAGQTLAENAISDLIRTPFGWHIVKLNYRTVPTREEQLRTARTEAFDTWLNEQRAAVTAQRFPPQTPTATAAPTAEAGPLPTVVLAGPITNTTSLSDTTTLTDTQPLTTDATAAPTNAPTATTTAATSAPTAATSAPTTGATAAPTAAP